MSNTVGHGSRHLLSMRWRDALFAHWPVEPDVIEPTLPEGLAVDTGPDGRAWLSIVGFVMEDIRPRFSPIGRSFPELNLRTYARHGDETGVYFYNLDADDRLSVAVARWLFKLPYYRAEMRVTERDGGIRYRSYRTHDGIAPAAFDATIEPQGTAEPVEPGSLAAFLVENYRFFVAGDGALYEGTIAHDRWAVAPAELTIRENTLFSAEGFDWPSSEPLVQYAPGESVTADRIRRVEHSL
ncbi:YqjF family protein [Halapricum hydrolyticum]|uniref:DUF2071 domain-containing protein n=1 Tax=Halapricum hydrolyticum TaxID=2979991 RepID=A0AAE3LEN7_9EURY|nr:DUF2071 domain-containing protein [Halapricum hydrolyticum]MCU4717408.1 DUF2071 domain-containing protein [Halapricum hydrolyticum]MCU4726572.1 DUF2071 domain-containing protein [Halapricum hydrolyticum]